MVAFDSDEYWLNTTWDRVDETARANSAVRAIFEQQELLVLDTVRQVIEQLPGKEPIQVLDLGCGTGRISRLIADAFGLRVEITLFDMNPATLAIAKDRMDRASRTRAIVGDARMLTNHLAGPFDVIVCLDLFHHLSEPERLLASIRRILAPGGVLVGNVFHAARFKQFDRLKYGWLGSLRRSTAFWLGVRIHSFAGSRLARAIRRYGWARIAPVSKEAFIRALGLHFDRIQVTEDHYLFFRADPAR